MVTPPESLLCGILYYILKRDLLSTYFCALHALRRIFSHFANHLHSMPFPARPRGAGEVSQTQFPFFVYSCAVLPIFTLL